MGKCNARRGLILLGFLLLQMAVVVQPSFASCRNDLIELRAADGRPLARFNVELADTPAKQARGLMHRESLAQSAGMLFTYDAPSHAVYWMRNTLIPLDMIFLDASGKIRHIHPQAIPHDETPIDGGREISAVLEINGGLAQRLGIKVGAQARHPFFAKIKAAWPCE